MKEPRANKSLHPLIAEPRIALLARRIQMPETRVVRVFEPAAKSHWTQSTPNPVGAQVEALHVRSMALLRRKYTIALNATRWFIDVNDIGLAVRLQGVERTESLGAVDTLEKISWNYKHI